MGKIFDELVCSGCRRKLSRKSQLFETGWLGVWWCGRKDCAFDIMQQNCDELSADDETNRED